MLQLLLYRISVKEQNSWVQTISQAPGVGSDAKMPATSSSEHIIILQLLIVEYSMNHRAS